MGKEKRRGERRKRGGESDKKKDVKKKGEGKS